METKRSLTTSGFTLPMSLFIFLALIASITSIYLSFHFYEVRYPSGLKDAANGICNLSGFFNCDGATFSPLAVFYGIPTAAFGAVLSVLFFLSALMPTLNWESTNKFLSLINFVGCLVLFFYSLIVLKSLCPLCTLYYVCSFGFFYLFAKHSDAPWFSPRISPSLFSLAAMLITAVSFAQYTSGLSEKQTGISQKIISEYRTLPKLDPFQYDSPFFISPLSSKPDAKVKISIFSDFQCPHCKRMAEEMEGITRRFKDKIAVNYYFFPLDSTCNSQIGTPMHPFACKAAMLSACDESKFAEAHLKIFENQETLSESYLQNLSKELGVESCYQQKGSYDLVTKAIDQGVAYGIESTPTMVINGVKIAGAIPPIHLMALIESLLNDNE